MDMKILLSIVVYEDGDLWVAQAVEHDIAARAATADEVPRAFERALLAHLTINRKLGRDALEGIAPAPPEFRVLFEKAAAFKISERDRQIGEFRLAEVA